MSYELDFLLQPVAFDPRSGAPLQATAGEQLHPQAQKQLHSRRGPANRPRTQELLGALVSAGPTLAGQLQFDDDWLSQEWRRQLCTQQRQDTRRRLLRHRRPPPHHHHHHHHHQQQQQGMPAGAAPFILPSAQTSQQHVLLPPHTLSLATPLPPNQPSVPSPHHHDTSTDTLQAPLITQPPTLTHAHAPWRAAQPPRARSRISGDSRERNRNKTFGGDRTGRLLGLCWGVLGRCAKPLLPAAGFLAAAGLCAFAPGWPSVLLGTAAICSRGQLFGLPLLPPWRPARLLLCPLQPLSQPMLVFAMMWTLMPPCFPGVWRALCYWNRILPLFVGYFRTNRKAKRLRARGRHAEADALWEEQHERGAEEMHLMLSDLKGFYMKLGQILATKTEMLPLPYTQSLSGLLDKLPPLPFKKVMRVLSRELSPRQRLSDIAYVEPSPMATATIAQVHGGTLQGPGQKRVAIKVQIPGVRRMMRADLVNLKLAVDLLDLLHIDLGFDLGSIVREYHVYVPMECDFKREAEGMQLVRAALKSWAMRQFPILRKVSIPRVYSHLSTDRVLVMSRVEGVPLLDTVGMDAHTKSESMAALVLAYGVQILLEGVFHTDPHPGNLMALRDPADNGLRVAILDWGQMKVLSHNERVRYALLVIAMASRDGELLRATLSELGVRIENCDDSFAEIAGYILFDTRMDMVEALESPMAKDSNVGWKTTRVPKLPQDLFMIMRAVTLLRGVLVSMQVFDVSSAVLWRPLAMQVLSELTYMPLALPAPEDSSSEHSQQSNQQAPPKALQLWSPTKTPTKASPRGQAPDTPAVLLAGRRFLAQQEVAVAHGQLSPRTGPHPLPPRHTTTPNTNTTTPNNNTTTPNHNTTTPTSLASTPTKSPAPTRTPAAPSPNTGTPPHYHAAHTHQPTTAAPSSSAPAPPSSSAAPPSAAASGGGSVSPYGAVHAQQPYYQYGSPIMKSAVSNNRQTTPLGDGSTSPTRSSLPAKPQPPPALHPTPSLHSAGSSKQLPVYTANGTTPHITAPIPMRRAEELAPDVSSMQVPCSVPQSPPAGGGLM